MLSSAYFLANLVLIQPRTSPPKICKLLPILPICSVLAPPLRPRNGHRSYRQSPLFSRPESCGASAPPTQRRSEMETLAEEIKNATAEREAEHETLETEFGLTLSSDGFLSKCLTQI